MFTALVVMQLFGVYASDVLVIVTAVLVILTGFYAFQTKKTVQVLDKAAKMEFLPRLQGHLHMTGPVNVDFRISNVGKGSASDVQVNFLVIGRNTIKRTWTQPLFTPNQFQDFPIPVSENEEQGSIPYFEVNETKIQITATYNDILGNSHSSKQEIDISEFVKQFKTTLSLYDEETMDEIPRNIKSISDDVKKITNNLSSIGDILSDRKQQDIIKLKFMNIYRQLNQMDPNLDTEVWMLLYSLENELLMSRRGEVLRTILTKLKEINIKAFNHIVQLEELKDLNLRW